MQTVRILKIFFAKIALHTQFVGEIIDVKADEAVLDDKGNASISKVKPILYAPTINCYYGIGNQIGAAFSIGKEIK